MRGELTWQFFTLSHPACRGSRRFEEEIVKLKITERRAIFCLHTRHFESEGRQA